MELINVEKEYIRDIEKYAHADEIERLDMIHSSAQISGYEHTMDNSSLDTSFGKMLHKLRTNGYAFMGIGKAPWLHHERDMAIIFEDVDTFEKYWYHTNSYIVEWWQEQVALYLRKDI